MCLHDHPQPPHRPCRAYVTSSIACAAGRLIPSQVWAGPCTQPAAVQQDTAHMEPGKIWRWAQTVSSDLFVTHYNHTELSVTCRPCNYVLCKPSWEIFLLQRCSSSFRVIRVKDQSWKHLWIQMIQCWQHSYAENITKKRHTCFTVIGASLQI